MRGRPLPSAPILFSATRVPAAPAALTRLPGSAPLVQDCERLFVAGSKVAGKGAVVATKAAGKGAVVATKAAGKGAVVATKAASKTIASSSGAVSSRLSNSSRLSSRELV